MVVVEKGWNLSIKKIQKLTNTGMWVSFNTYTDKEVVDIFITEDDLKIMGRAFRCFVSDGERKLNYVTVFENSD